MDLAHTAEQRIRAAGLLTQGDAVIVAVSGGPDSVALLHVLFTLSRRAQWGWRLIVAHVNHGFRGAESDAEAAYVEQLAAKLGLPFELARLDMPAELARTGENAQAASRERRYAFLHDTAAKHAAGKIALAHHADDQAETVLMRVLRGTGIAGLAGIPEKRLEKKVELIRPLLRIYKSEIMEYCYSHNLLFYRDSSNETLKYARNRIRLEAMPFLSRYNPQLPEALNRLAVTAADEDAFLEEAARAAFLRTVRTEGAGPELRLTVERAAFAGLHVALQRRLVKLILSCLVSGGLVDFTVMEQARQAVLQNEKPNLALDLGGGCQLVREYGTVTFRLGKTAQEPRPFLYIMEEKTMRLPMPELGLELRCEAVTDLGNALEGAPDDESSALFDADGLAYPLAVRPRNRGDRMRPLGLNGSKKVKDIFIDEKVPPHLRDRLPLVTDREGRVLWIPGVKRSDYAVASEGTERLIRMSLHRMAGSASS